MEPLNQARAILVAQLLELCPVISSIIGLYYNSPTNSIYLTISWEPRLCWKVAHSILLSLLLMQPLNQARASLAAQLLELCPVICSIINLYYNSPTNRIYLPISWEPRLCLQLAHSILFSLLPMEPKNQARAILWANLLELWTFICSSIIGLYSHSPKHSIYLALSWEPRLCLELTHSVMMSFLLMEPLNLARAILGAQLLDPWPVICSIFCRYFPTLPQIGYISPFLGNSPTNRIYLVFSWEPRLCLQLAHSILLSLLLMEALNQARASLGVQLPELWPVICSIINHIAP
jgi:hypothetical protein